MPHRPCEIAECPGLPSIRDGDCSDCPKAYCNRHLEEVCHHPCNAPTDSTNAVARFVNRDPSYLWEPLYLQQVAEAASALRPGHRCCIPDEEDTLGFDAGPNTHYLLEFEDGVKWVLRRRRDGTEVSPPAAVWEGMTSEIATIEYLASLGLKVPRAFTLPQLWTPEYPRHFVETFLPGEPHPIFFEVGDHVTVDDLSDGCIEVPMDELVRWNIALEANTFDRVGSFTFDSTGQIIIGPIISRNELSHEAPFYRGPYQNAKGRYEDYFTTVLTNILEGTWCKSSAQLHVYLVNLEARSLVTACVELESGPWYLKHADTNGGYILYENDRLTGVIDWEWAYTTSKGDAFVAPLAFQPLEYADGSNALGLLETQLIEAYHRANRPDLADLVKNGKKYQRLNSVVDSFFESNFREMNAMRRAFLGIEDNDPSWNEPQTREEWINVMMERYKDDEGLKRLIGKQSGTWSPWSLFKDNVFIQLLRYLFYF